MEKILLKEYMRRANPWWDEKFTPPTTEYKEREVYKEVVKSLPLRFITALTGLRRVGKTTILMELLKQKIDEGFDKKRIFYFLFDEFSDIRIMDLLDVYGEIFEKIGREHKYLVIFDEIQKIKNWSEQIKVIYDLYPNIKFIISGSESLFIRKKSRESLAGRIFEYTVNPLSFKEFLRFKNIKIDNLFLQKDIIQENLKQFLLTSGFPEIINHGEEDARKYIREGVIEKVIYSDFVKVFEVKNIDSVRSVFDVIHNDPGQIIEINSLAGELGISRGVLSNYLEYLEEAFLIKKLYNYSRNARKTQRRLKRFYSTVTNPLLFKTNFSKLFEQFVAVQLNADFFWRDSFKNEVDIIKPDPLTAIEIKSGEIKARDLASLQRFIKKFSPKEAMVITYDIKKTLAGIKLVPFYELLLKKQK